MLFVRECFELFETHESRIRAALAKNVRSDNMVGNTIDPGARGTPGIEPLEATPQLKMNLLNQVATLFGVSLVRAGESFERRPVLVRSIPAQVILARLPRQDGLSSSHI